LLSPANRRNPSVFNARQRCSASQSALLPPTDDRLLLSLDDASQSGGLAAGPPPPTPLSRPIGTPQVVGGHTAGARRTRLLPIPSNGRLSGASAGCPRSRSAAASTRTVAAGPDSRYVPQSMLPTPSGNAHRRCRETDHPLCPTDRPMSCDALRRARAFSLDADRLLTKLKFDFCCQLWGRDVVKNNKLRNRLRRAHAQCHKLIDQSADRCAGKRRAAALADFELPRWRARAKTWSAAAAANAARGAPRNRRRRRGHYPAKNVYYKSFRRRRRQPERQRASDNG
jgi:hypothetical protein